MTPSARKALECIVDADNREEAELLLSLHGYHIINLGLYSVAANLSVDAGWVMDAYDDCINPRGHLADIPYSQILQVLYGRRISRLASLHPRLLHHG